MSRGRKAVTMEDLRPFLERTGQTHLLTDPPKPKEFARERPVQAISAPKGGDTAGKPPEGEKKTARRLKMNQTEREYSRMLDRAVELGEIKAWRFEGMTFRWGEVDVMKYTPDFVVFDKLEGYEVTARFIEVKGAHIRSRQAAIRAFKGARNEFTMYRFELWQKTKDKGWTRQL